LLHATLCAATSAGLQVAALHVHHGLSPNADAWLAHARRTCAAWARAGRPLRLFTVRLTARPARGDSVEAWAREQRYAALADLAREAGAPLVLLAHHRRDQAETLLLQALRGAGVAGLAAMPRLRVRDGLAWARPWLDTDPDDIAAYVARHRLRHVDDESNHDPRWARSRLRSVVWPVLQAAFPQAEPMLARTARWMAEADAALGPSGADRDTGPADTPAVPLDLAPLRDQAPARLRATLRAWLRERLGVPAPATLIDRLLTEACRAEHGQWPAPGGELRLVRGRLAFHRAPAAAGAPGKHRPTMAASAGVNAPPTAVLLQAARQPIAPWLPARRPTGPRRLRLPGWAGAWLLRPTDHDGVAWARLQHADARMRSGGESFQAGPGRPPRALKKQFQSAGIDRWHRDGPLLWQGDTLLAVPGLGVDARARAAPGEPQVTLTWLPDAAEEPR
jgi:tRNA(Ile)-lysidine synthase